MNKKAITATLLATAMLTLGSAASADSNPLQSSQTTTSEVSQETGDNSTIKVRVIDEDIFYPMDSILINSAHHTGPTAYTGDFGTSPSNGKSMNVWVKNNASTAVYVTISRNGSEIVSSYELKGKAQNTFNFEEFVGSGLTGNWKVYVYNKNGASYDLNINARQFN